MSAESAIALVLRAIPWSETSLIVTLFSREFGKISGIAKGGRRLKGPFDSALDLLTLCRIVFLRKASDALDLLTEAKLVRRFHPHGRDLASLYAAYYVAELLQDLTDEYDPHPELFDLAVETLEGLSAGEAPARRILRFELGMLRELGHLPLFDQCAECGREIVPAERVAFGPLQGGVLCEACRAGKQQVAMVGAATIRTLAELGDAEAALWARIEVDPRTHGEMRGLMNHYLRNLLGHKPRLCEYLTLLAH